MFDYKLVYRDYLFNLLTAVSTGLLSGIQDFSSICSVFKWSIANKCLFFFTILYENNIR